MAKTLKLRKSMIDLRYDFDDVSEYIGREVYPIKKEQLQQPCTVWYRLLDEPGRTNMSHTPRIHGWLGATDNINATALGRYRVTGQSKTHLHLTEITD